MPVIQETIKPGINIDPRISSIEEDPAPAKERGAAEIDTVRFLLTLELTEHTQGDPRSPACLIRSIPRSTGCPYSHLPAPPFQLA